MHCRLCTNPDVRVIDRIKTPNCEQAVPVCYCKSCGHYSLFPIQYQRQKAFEWDGVNYYLRDAGRRKQAATQIIERLLAAYRKANGKLPRNFLDAGCAIGLSLPLAEARGMQSVGVEPEARLAKYGREQLGVDIRHGMLGKMDLGSRCFDLIYCEQVLEHVGDPPQFLQTLKGLLAPGGQLYIGVPPVFPLNRFTTFLIRKLGQRPSGSVLTNIFYDPDEHINTFSRRSMRKLAHGCEMDLQILPLDLSSLKPRRVLKHLLALGSNPGTFLLSRSKND